MDAYKGHTLVQTNRYSSTAPECRANASEFAVKNLGLQVQGQTHTAVLMDEPASFRWALSSGSSGSSCSVHDGVSAPPARRL
jgi:hypothetical protein